tara:strand:+ start:24685 stop:25062 length:378 start_codon:yes stop_codon:yes gene_type:complete
VQISNNFTLEEWKCHDGTHVPFNLVDSVKECAENLQHLRNKLGRAIIVVSGYRNPSYNEKIGGSKNSYHMRGMATDIKVSRMDPKDVHAAVEELIKDGIMRQGGLGLYKNFVHVDIRGTKARWNG